MNRNASALLLLCIITANVLAETDLSVIEEQERAQIISELTYRLEIKQNCTQTLNWDDSGSGADLDGYFFLPNTGKAEYIIGGHASGKRTSKHHCVTTVSQAAGNPKETPPLLVAPADWKQVWKDSGSGAAKDGSFWQAIPPDDNYKCIGSVSQLVHNTKPNLPNYRCVHTSLTDKIVATAVRWSDKGTGADQQVTIFSLPTTGAYIAVDSRANQVETYDLKKNATSVPDPKEVEAILAKRMAPLKADIEEKTKVLQEQKEVAKNEEAKKEEDKKAAAKKAEQKKIAVAKEKKKQEALAANADTVTETKQDNNAEEEAQKLKEQQQARIAKAMEEKAVAEKAMQKEEMTKQVKKEEAKEEEIKSESEPKAVVEASAKVEPIETKSASASESNSESKGLNDIIMFFVKIFGILIGGVIVFLIAFKALFGKKKILNGG